MTEAEALKNARAFNAGRRWSRPSKLRIDKIESSVVREAMINSPLVQSTIKGMMSQTGASREDSEDALLRAHNLGELLTPEELAERLKADVKWVYSKQRSRCKNPIPSKPLGRILRFDWDEVVQWLEQQTNRPALKATPHKKKRI